MMKIFDYSANMKEEYSSIKEEEDEEEGSVSPPPSIYSPDLPYQLLHPSQDRDRLRQFAEIATSSSPSLHSKLLSSLLYSSLLSSSLLPPSATYSPPQEAPMDLSLSRKEGVERRDSVGSTISTGSNDSDSDR